MARKPSDDVEQTAETADPQETIQGLLQRIEALEYQVKDLEGRSFDADDLPLFRMAATMVRDSPASGTGAVERCNDYLKRWEV